MAVFLMDLVLFQRQAGLTRLAPNMHGLTGDIMFAIVLGVSLGQVGLLGAWLVFGGKSVLVRSGALLAGSVALTILIATYSRHDVDLWLGHVGLFNLMLLGILGVLRLCGLRIHDTHGPGGARPKCQTVCRRYSLTTLMGLMTSVAFACGVYRLAKFPWQFKVQIVAYSCGYSVIVLLALTAVLGQRAGLRSAMLAMMGSAAIGAYLGFIEQQVGLNSAVCAVEAVFICTSAAVLRTEHLRILTAAPPDYDFGLSNRTTSDVVPSR